MTAYTDIIRYDGPSDLSDWVVYRHPAEQIAGGTRLVVGPGQQVLLIKNGQSSCYDAGSYVLGGEGGLFGAAQGFDAAVCQYP